MLILITKCDINGFPSLLLLLAFTTYPFLVWFGNRIKHWFAYTTPYYLIIVQIWLQYYFHEYLSETLYWLIFIAFSLQLVLYMLLPSPTGKWFPPSSSCSSTSSSFANFLFSAASPPLCDVFVMGQLFSRSRTNNNNNSSSNNNNNGTSQGKSTPEHKSPALGTYPLNDINSVVSKEDVRKCFSWKVFLVVIEYYAIIVTLWE